MRFFVVVLFLSLCALNSAKRDKEWLLRELDVINILKYVNQPSYFPDYVQIGLNYKFDPENYKDPKVVIKYQNLIKNGLTPRSEIFSVFYEDQLEEVKALYDLLYNAKTYETFNSTAIWARQNVNPGLFVYTYIVTLLRREDTKNLIIPPLYEVYPYYFFTFDTIHQALRYKQEKSLNRTLIINAGYSTYYELNEEQLLAYFSEDIGLNIYYFYYNVYNPYWLKSDDYQTITFRGESYYFVYQQLLARYYMERLANGFGKIPVFNYQLPLRVGFCPSLRYPSGLEFPSRPPYTNLYEYFYNYGQVKENFDYASSFYKIADYERRIRDIIDRQFLPLEEKIVFNINVLGNMIQGNEDSLDKRFYGNVEKYARHILGYSYQTLDRAKRAPSALEQYETTLRDPAFYRLANRLVYYFQRYKSYLPPYSEDDLSFSQLKILEVSFGKLVTRFKRFQSDISNAVFVNSEEFLNNRVNIKASQERLSFDPFNYQIKIDSEGNQLVAGRVFLGPRYDEKGLEFRIGRNSENYFQLDSFICSITSGTNFVNRSSNDMLAYFDDPTSYKELEKQVNDALYSNGSGPIDPIGYAFPRRLMLPKGSLAGTDYQIYVIITPIFVKDQDKEKEPKPVNEDSSTQFTSVFAPRDGRAMGFPFDRPILYDNLYYNISNAYLSFTKIYFEK